MQSHKGTSCRKAAAGGRRAGSCTRGSRSRLRGGHSSQATAAGMFSRRARSPSSGPDLSAGDGRRCLPSPTCLARPEHCPPTPEDVLLGRTHSRCTGGLTGSEAAAVLRRGGFRGRGQPCRNSRTRISYRLKGVDGFKLVTKLNRRMLTLFQLDLSAVCGPQPAKHKP